ncbi:unnamed protein product [Brassicogethes aeneus]|uniref:Large ribosomal subunit protein bL9m n=1 Tax=Brassicogethes aeneus TaxID=1431903 RepID=A0A9P0AX41_BRAAE|nr:unnamed protein product [Brassicogethes aeneus]
MWKSIIKPLNIVNKAFLSPTENVVHQQLRTTYVLKRKTPPRLHKKNSDPKPLRSRHYVYELVKNEELEKKANINVILTTYVEGLGNKGEKVSVKPKYAYQDLLLPGLAVYESPENVEKYKDFMTNPMSDVEAHSSPTAMLTVRSLSGIMLSVVMNKDTHWSLKPWHIKVSFRKCGYIVPEHAIIMPEQEIKGPNMDLENREFFVTVKINNKETVPVRCRIHHWSTEVKDRIPYASEFWKEKVEPIFDEHSSVLNSIPHKAELKK